MMITRPLVASSFNRGQVHVGEHFENDVHTAAARGFQDFFLITRLAVIENLMRTFPLCEVEAFCVPAVPKMVRPMARAICTAALPTPPLAPCTSTLSEACASAEW